MPRKKFIQELFRDEKSSNISLPAYGQPLCTAVQVALVDLLAYWGIKPTAVVYGQTNKKEYELQILQHST